MMSINQQPFLVYGDKKYFLISSFHPRHNWVIDLMEEVQISYIRKVYKFELEQEDIGNFNLYVLDGWAEQARQLINQKEQAEFTPKALLPAKRCYRPPTPKERLLKIVEVLDGIGVLTDYNARLFEAVATVSLAWDEDAYLKFESLALEQATNIFDAAFQNTPYQESLSSPENPKNWKK